LVQLQDSIPGLTKAARLEKRIAILSAAVEANPACDQLWLRLIRFSGQMMGAADLERIWARALLACPSALVHERYVRALLVSFSQVFPPFFSHFSPFNFIFSHFFRILFNVTFHFFRHFFLFYRNLIDFRLVFGGGGS
jgi:hypothetical protein